MTEKQYPELPKVGPIGYASVVDIERYAAQLDIGPHLPGVRDIALWTTDQMRAYVDADRAMRAAQAAPASQDAATGLKDGDIAALVNRLRDIAIEYSDTQQLRERIASEIRPRAAGLVGGGINKIDSQRILELTAQLAEAQRDSERLDWMIEQCAYVVSDPDCCDGYWLNYLRPDGIRWVQLTEYETPRAAIDAAKGESNGTVRAERSGFDTLPDDYETGDY